MSVKGWHKKTKGFPSLNSLSLPPHHHLHAGDLKGSLDQQHLPLAAVEMSFTSLPLDTCDMSHDMFSGKRMKLITKAAVGIHKMRLCTAQTTPRHACCHTGSMRFWSRVGSERTEEEPTYPEDALEVTFGSSGHEGVYFFCGGGLFYLEDGVCNGGVGQRHSHGESCMHAQPQ
jgi:hypothetical protein